MGDNIIPATEPRELLRRLCVEHGEDYAGLSRLIGRNSAYVQQFIRRGTPRRLPERERRILARHFGIDERLLGAENRASPTGDFHIPDPIGDTAPVIAFAPEFLAQLNGESGSIQRARVLGDQMAPTFAAGDQLLVDIADGAATLRDGLYLIRIDGLAQVRRLVLHPVRRELTVQSDNPAYADWPGVARDELEIVGRLVWAGRRLL